MLKLALIANPRIAVVVSALFPSLVIVDSCRAAKRLGQYWLLDEIALAQRYQKKIATEEFQLWKLTVKANRTATLACDDGEMMPRFAAGRALQRTFGFVSRPKAALDGAHHFARCQG